MNTQSITCRRVKFGEMQRPGDFTFSDDFKTIYLWYPGLHAPDALQIQKGPPSGEHVWGWNGDEESPTLEPSILCPGRWHGYLRQGKLESC